MPWHALACGDDGPRHSLYDFVFGRYKPHLFDGVTIYSSSSHLMRASIEDCCTINGGISMPGGRGGSRAAANNAGITSAPGNGGWVGIHPRRVYEDRRAGPGRASRGICAPIPTYVLHWGVACVHTGIIRQRFARTAGGVRHCRPTTAFGLRV